MAAPSSRQSLRDCALLLLIAAAPALLTFWLHPKRPVWSWTKPAVEQVDLAEITRWKTPVLWVDAREVSAFAKQHIPDAIPLNETEWNRLLPGFLEAWQPASKIVVYCNTRECDASQAVALRLKREMNLSNVFVLRGGWAAWQQAHP
ncbi:MAG TPA: rhodanese-like domain-containing protein [Lacunisphaera sp.]|nr:rhodanese-like domain-containing protein [Lacunisphaera sp.]